MRLRKLHDWNLSVSEGRGLQERLAGRVQIRPLPPDIRLVAGADVAFSLEARAFFASVVVLELPALQVVEEVSARHRPTFPYVPGMLTFREGPVLLRAFAKLKHAPDAVLFDGQGIAHPRRLGLASHLGLWLNLPTIGCAKSRLIGEHAEPGRRQGAARDLLDGGERIGLVLRTQNGVNPIYLSPGHLSDVDSAARLVLRCLTRYRLPEPTRLADIRVAQVKRAFLASRQRYEQKKS
jgi:deoxyribonuclease V